MNAQPQTGLVPVPISWQHIFPFQHFNRVQSACFDHAHGSDRSLVVAAPTGSGKTAVLEMALVRLFGVGGSARGAVKAVYFAPLKSLTHERLLDWRRKLTPLQIVEMTGDSGDEASDERTVAGADIILTTPEN